MKKLGGRRKTGRLSFLFSLAIGVFFLGVLVYGARSLDHMSRMQNVDLIRQSVRRAAVQCYAIEGIYPADVDYLREHYGVNVDSEKYYIEYAAIGPNIMPDIEVYERE